MLERIDQLEADARTDLEQVADSASLEVFRIKYLGTKGAIKDLMGLMKDVPKEQKRDFGQKANALKNTLAEAFETKTQTLGKIGRAHV